MAGSLRRGWQGRAGGGSNGVRAGGGAAGRRSQELEQDLTVGGLP